MSPLGAVFESVVLSDSERIGRPRFTLAHALAAYAVAREDVQVLYGFTRFWVVRSIHEHCSWQTVRDLLSRYIAFMDRKIDGRSPAVFNSNSESAIRKPKEPAAGTNSTASGSTLSVPLFRS